MEDVVASFGFQVVVGDEAAEGEVTEAKGCEFALDGLCVNVFGVGEVSQVLLASCQKCHDMATYSLAVEWMRRMLSPGKTCTRGPRRSVTPMRSL